MIKRPTCRFCNGNLTRILSLGEMPIVNYFPTKEELSHEKKYPLHFWVCITCGLAQLYPIISPEKTFRLYHYASGASQPLVVHLKKLADTCNSMIGKKGAPVLDIGCNDGWFLSRMKELGHQTLGIDPAVEVVQMARAKGLDVIPEFFSSRLANDIKKKRGEFDLIVLTHTLANIADINDLFKGIRHILARDGMIVIEVGSLEEMIEKTQFDAIYHEHYSYFSMTTLMKILKKHGFSVCKSETLPIQGSAHRVFARKIEKSENVAESNMVKETISIADFRMFAKKVREYRTSFRKTIAELKGKRVVGFGAPAKAVTLLNYCGVTDKKIPYIVDSTIYKQGRYMPGVHIPILQEEELARINPDVVMLLSWTYKEAILKKLPRLLPPDTSILIPFPNITVSRLS